MSPDGSGEWDEWVRFLGPRLGAAYPEAIHTHHLDIYWEQRRQSWRIVTFGTDPSVAPLEIYSGTIHEGVLALLETLGSESTHQRTR